MFDLMVQLVLLVEQCLDRLVHDGHMGPKLTGVPHLHWKPAASRRVIFTSPMSGWRFRPRPGFSAGWYFSWSDSVPAAEAKKGRWCKLGYAPYTQTSGLDRVVGQRPLVVGQSDVAYLCECGLQKLVIELRELQMIAALWNRQLWATQAVLSKTRALCDDDDGDYYYYYDLHHILVLIYYEPTLSAS